jgi:hypothetical protein
LSAARTHDNRQLPDSLGERIVVACCLAWLFAGVIAFIVASTIGAGAAAATFLVVSVTLAIYIARFLSTSSRPSRVHQLAREHQCCVCGAPFTPIRANQIYCGRPCREEAAARRRKNRLEAARPSRTASGPSDLAPQPSRWVMRRLTRRGVRRRLEILRARAHGGPDAQRSR